MIEVMVTVLIVGILTSIAAPAYKSFVINARLNGEMDALTSALSFARSEAQKRGQRVSVCPGTALTCTADWSAGWHVLLIGTPNQRLLVRAPRSNGDTITNSAARPPEFNAAGYTFFTGTLTIKDSSDTPEYRRCIQFAAGSWVTKKGTACP